MARTNQQLIDEADPNTQPNAFAQLRDTDGNGHGAFLRSFVPALVERSGLVSGATHIEAAAGLITGVTDTAGTAKMSIIVGGTAAAGEVLIVYDGAGVPTLTFGDGARTGYKVVKQELPDGWAAALAAVGS